MAIGIILLLSLYQKSIPLWNTSGIYEYSALLSLSTSIILDHIYSALIASAFFLALNLLSKGKGMGFGDVKLSFVMGLLLGWPGIVTAILSAFIIGGIWGGYLLLLKMRGMKDRVPFGPILVLGFLISFFFGNALIGGYFKIFGL